MNNGSVVKAIDQIIAGLQLLRLEFSDSQPRPKTEAHRAPNKSCRVCGSRFWGTSRKLCSNKCAQAEIKSKWKLRQCIQCKQDFHPTVSSRQKICSDECRLARGKYWDTNRNPRAVVDYSPGATIKRSESQQMRRLLEKEQPQEIVKPEPVVVRSKKDEQFGGSLRSIKKSHQKRPCTWCGKLTLKNTYCSESCRKSKERVEASRLGEPSSTGQQPQEAANIPMNTLPRPKAKAVGYPKPPQKPTTEGLPSTFNWGKEAEESRRRLQARAVKIPRLHQDANVRDAIEKVKQENANRSFDVSLK